MNAFGRVVRLAMRHRFTFCLSVVCAMGVALLWGGNIGALYPFLKVILQNQSLQQWVQEEISSREDRLVQLQDAETALEAACQQAAPAQRTPLESELHSKQWSRFWQAKLLDLYRRVQPLLEKYCPTDPFRTLLLLLGAMLVGTLLKEIFVVAHSLLVAWIAERTVFDLRKLFYRRTLRMDLATFTDEGTSDLMSRFTNDMNSVSFGLISLFGRLVRESLKGLACLIGAGLICWRLLLLSLIVAPVAGLSIRWLSKSLKRVNRRAMEQMAQIYSALDETFRGIKLVKAFTMERHERHHFHVTSKAYLRRAMKIARYDALAHPLTEVTGMLVIWLAILAGAWLLLNGQTRLLGITISDFPLDREALLVFYCLLAGASDPARKLSDVLARLQQASAATDRVYALLEREPVITDPPCPVPLARHRQHLVFDNVHFAYQTGRPVLQDVNLRIDFGEALAIVGSNGCGKSTLLNLVPRFADPTAGEVRLDGVPLADVRLHDLRAQIGLVTQETLLFDDTVFNNIRYGSPQATREQVLQAAQQAHAQRFIEDQLPAGYETVVGQFGGRLSGGQRQRIALARAILRDPAVILLDEATSQVDLESEQLIQRVLERFIRNRTAIFITHRPSLLSLADRIAVMDEGRIVDVGTHAELAARCGLYARLCQVQFRQTA